MIASTVPPVLVPKPEIPDGYRSGDGGLLIPEVVERKRIVWTKADVKQIDRATRFLKAEGVLFQFACASCGPKRGMRLTRDAETGQKMLECGCTRRILSGAI